MELIEKHNKLKEKIVIIINHLKDGVKSNQEYQTEENLIQWFDFKFIIKHQILPYLNIVKFKTFEVIESENELNKTEIRHVKELDFKLLLKEDEGYFLFFNLKTDKLYKIGIEDKIEDKFYKQYFENLEEWVKKTHL